MKGKHMNANVYVWVNPHIDMSSIKDSMQLDSYQDIAYLKDANINITVSIEVRGEVKVWFNRHGGNPFDGEWFSTPSDFPKELKTLIAENNRWYEDERLFIDENNWFEAFVEAPMTRIQFDSELVDIEGMSTEELTQFLYELYRCWKKNIYEEFAFRRAKSYAAASLYYFNIDNVRLAARYWNRIYGLRFLRSEDLFKTMSFFPDDAVYSITHYIRERTYRVNGLI